MTRASSETIGFGEVHEVLIVGIGLVKFHHGKFRIVLDGHPLIPEIAIDFINPLQAADDQALQIQLRGDAQEQGHVQGMVIGLERAWPSPPRV